MPTIYQLKPAFQNLLRPVVAQLAKIGVTANQVTVFAMLLSAMGGFAIFAWPTQYWPLFALPGVLFVRMGLNAIDGMLAREFGMKSRLGAILNEMGDVVSDAALYLPFAFIPGVSGLWVTVVVLLSLLTEMAGVVAIQIGSARRYDGPFGKSDRAFAFGVLALLLGFGIKPGSWFTLVLMVMSLLSVFTVFKRCRKALENPT